MKLTRIFTGITALLMGAAVLTACSGEDDYFASTTPLLTNGAVVTGSSDVTATTATFHGTVKGLEKMNVASYATGFKYGYAENALTETATAASVADFSASLSGLKNNTTIYYQAYVTLQGKLTYSGEVKSLVTTDATATTGEASAIDFANATMAGVISKYPADAVSGIVISTSDNVEAVRAGLRLTAETLTDSYTLTMKGLMPATVYYYAAFLDLGSGVVYGDVKSFTTSANEIDANEEFVDLGLSVKWGKRNVGAVNVSDMGGHFGFGDMTGINPSIDPADYASTDTYKTTSDVAYQATGGKAMLPTAEQFEEMFRLCKIEFTEMDGVSGYQVTGVNGNSIFLPAAGKRVGHDMQEQGVTGFYMTGNANPTNAQYSVDFEFSATGKSRATLAVYEALSVRPVSLAKNVKFDKSLLYSKWYLDNGVDGKQHVWEGPFTQWGKTDNWGTVTNGEPNPYQSIHWEMGKDNGWIGYTYGKDYGYMEFRNTDGKDSIFVHRIAEDGTITDEIAPVVIDEKNKTITTDINVLCANTWVAVKSGTLNILSLTEDGLQIGILNNDDYQYSLNYYSQAKADADAKIVVNMICVGNDWNGSWGSQMDAIAPEALNGQHTFHYDGACNGLKVNTIDFVGLKARYPNAVVRIDEIKLDGTAIKFNANNFCYGDIENNGNFRVELANVWGKTAKNEKIIASPFSNLTDTDNDPAFTFASSMDVTYTILTDGLKTYKPNLITINPSWGGPWDYNDGAAFDVVLNSETGKYELSKSNFTVTYNSDQHADGSIMTFIEIADLFGAFPGTHATLNALELDGQAVTFDATKVLDTNEGTKYRLELWNCYGATGAAGCAFGNRDGDVIHELGFSSSMKLDFTINSLFATPEF